jgi:Tol biopolymer transport system component
MPLSPGLHLGPYEILSPLGAGGMGEVYRAKDPRLGRDVAIKVLPPSFSADADRLRRFEQEARAAGMLNHPNITAVYDIGSHEGAAYVVEELLQGETLRAALAGGKLSPRRAVQTAIEIARGLAAAHERGIVHRDLKPENIFVTGDGRVKILDFGLAKLIQTEESGTATDLPTVTPGTEPGVVLGTLGYMSPEQVRGKRADHRSDIFSLGAILHELLSGKRAFHGDSAADTMSAILKEDPPELSVTNQQIAPALDRIVRHCLEKNPERRLHSAHDLAFELESLSQASGAAAPLPARRSRGYLRVLGVAAGVAAIAAAAFLAGRRGTTGPSRSRGAFATYSRLTNLAGREDSPSLSPDGKDLAFVRRTSGKLDVWVQRAGGRKPVDLTPDCDVDSFSPAFSPDGNLIAYGSGCAGAGLFLMGATGENARKLTSSGSDPAWTVDGGEIVYTTEIAWSPYGRATTSELWAVNVSTGKTRRLFAGDAVQPSVSPHGLRIAYWGLRGSSSQRDIWTIPIGGLAPGQQPETVTNDAAVDWNPVWAPDGKSLWFLSNRDGSMNLWRVSIDERSGKVLGSPEPRTLPASEVGGFTLSRDGGRLAYVVGQSSYTLERVGYDTRSGQLQGSPAIVIQTGQEISRPVISPDNQWIAFDSSGGAQEDLFLMHTDGTGLRQLTDDAPRDRNACFSPDGRRIVFMSDRSGDWQLWTIATDGSGLSQLTRTREVVFIPHWSPDGRRIAANNGKDAFLFELDEKSEVKNTTTLPHPAGNPVVAAQGWMQDGRLVVTFRRPDYTVVGAALYSIDAHSYEPVPLPPRVAGFQLRADSGFLVFADRMLLLTPDGLYAAPVAGHGGRLLLPHLKNGDYSQMSASRDGSQIYLLQSQENADIWQATLPK